MFGRRVTPPGPRERSEPTPDTVPLSLDDISRYVVVAARARGYPEDFLANAARRVRFLEARGLPGFTAFTLEMLGARSETLQQRASVTRPDGSAGGQCPMIDAVRIGDKLDMIAGLPPGQVAAYPMPSNPLLVVPKLAEYAGPNGVIMMATFYLRGEPVTRVLVDGHRVAVDGPYEAILDAEDFGISRFPEETYGVPALRAASIDSIDFPSRGLSNLMKFVEEFR